jgi:ankyrin repeat protein
LQDLIVDAQSAHEAFLNARDQRVRKIAKGDYEVKFTRIRLLLTEHPEVLNSKLNEMLHTPLHFCALFGNLDIALLLLEHGADR